MENYEIMPNLDCKLELRLQSKEYLKAYAKWYFEQYESRLNYFINYVKSCKGFEDWNADFSLESLKDLGKWLVPRVEREYLTEAEFELKQSKYRFEVNNWELSERTHQIAFDISLYSIEVLKNLNKSFIVKQYLPNSTRDLSRGQICVFGESKMEYEPRNVSTVLCYKVANKNNDPIKLVDVIYHAVSNNYLYLTNQGHLAKDYRYE